MGFNSGFKGLNTCEWSATSSGYFTAIRRSRDNNLIRNLMTSEQFCTRSP